MQRWVERRAFGLDALQTLGRERVGQLRVDELDALEQSILIDIFGDVQQRQPEIVEDLEQAAHDRFGRHLDRGRLLAQDALAVVVELGLQAL